MKKLLFLFVFQFFFNTVFSQSTTKRFSLGLINFKDTVSVDYDLKNNTGKPLVILSSRSSCDCTWIEYPKQPIRNGTVARLKVFLYAKDKGNILKNINIYLSDGTNHTITLIGKVDKTVR